MKKLKRIGSVLLALALVLSLSLTALAAGVTVDQSRKGSITLYKYDLTSARAAFAASGQELPTLISNGSQNAEAERTFAPYAIEGVEFTYLRVADIVDVTTVETDGKATVVLLYGFRSLGLPNLLGLTTADKVEGGVSYFRSDTLRDALANYLTDSTTAKNAIEVFVKSNGGTAMTETDANGRTTASNLPVGLYLMAETRVPENVTSTVNPFFVSLPTTVNGTEWVYDLYAYPKNETGNPTLEKTLRESQRDTGKTADYTHTATGSAGDVVDYQIVSKLPTITSNATALTTYTYLDTLSKGIEYNKKDVTIRFCTDAALANTVAEWNEASGKFTVVYGAADNSATTMTIAMTAAGLSEINTATTVYTSGVRRGYSDCYMVINYACTVNSDADTVMGDSGNPNEVTLTWKRTNTAYFDTLKDDCHFYTYGLDLTKEFTTDGGSFADVKFIMENKTDNYFVKAELKDGVYYVTDHVAQKDATQLVPDADGLIRIRGLEDDTYVLTETATTNGFNPLADPITVVITSAESATKCGVCGKAFLTASATVNSKDVTMLENNGSVNALVPLTVVNTRTTVFPPTGEAGTAWLSVLGILGMAAAAILIVFIIRKKPAKEEADK